MNCRACGFENRADARFCRECGSALAAACPTCGAPNEPGQKFCDACGTALTAPSGEPAAPVPAVAERRLVSVLFADLVGFTAGSEEQDPEEVRELLSRYFESARRVIERYGGTVEKFIGDAVMAVWGTPVAQEDDAERAVRAALDLVAAVPELDERLRARAGVLTGEAAVTLGAETQGMVAGDLVNTASRIQAEADPGTVLVGESTRRASDAAIAYEDAGPHELRGKAEPLTLWRARRVVAGRGGEGRSTGLEPPFVGRERELRLVKELFHGCAEDRKAHLASVVGVAGMGKSRLTWEFEKYVDGLIELVRWHRGRCLAYGEGVAYWALAEMVRMRAGIGEGEATEAARDKLREAVETYVAYADERAWVEPRLAQLLGLEERHVHEREDLFAGWRLFFERMAEQQPVVMVFEDLHWADASLVDFIEYLLEWSRSYPIYVLTLARPELVERNPQWGAGKRNFSSISLEPLSAEVMEELLSGLVPGLPAELRAQIFGRAEGVPLYAVETVRMLLDRGLLEREGDVYRPTGPVEALDVPETLHALIAARLDGLEPGERRVLQDASVLGKTFAMEALAALSDVSEDALEPVLSALVRKEFLSVHADLRSPERGQYGFVQDLLRRVAYETLGRRERKARHLAAATQFEHTSGPGEPEVVEVVASHYLDAYEAAPDDEDACVIKARAREALTRAGERAASLAASEEAERYFAQAAELADEPLGEADLSERAGEMAAAAGRHEQAQAHYERSIELLEAQDETHPTARVLARLGWVEWQRGQPERAVERMEHAFAVLSTDEPDADFAALTAELGRLHFFANNLERAYELLELAVGLGESLLLPEVLSQSMNTNGLIWNWRGCPEVAFALQAHALKLALEHDLPTPALRAYNNLGDNLGSRDHYEEALAYHDRGIALARRVGNRQWEWQLLIESTYPLALTGRWDEALARASELPESHIAGALAIPPLTPVEIEVARGRIAEARHLVSLLPNVEAAGDVQQRAILASLNAVVLRAEGRTADALRASKEAFDARRVLSMSHTSVKLGFVEAVEAALLLGQLDVVERLLATVEALRPGEIVPFVRAHDQRFRARVAAARGNQEAVKPRFKGAAAIFREFGIPFCLAVTLLEHGEWLADQGQHNEAEPLVREAAEIFERLDARPWIERAKAGAGVAA